VASVKQPGYLPDHRWVVEAQEIIVRPEDVGEPAGVPVSNSGLTFLSVSIVERNSIGRSLALENAKWPFRPPRWAGFA